MKRILGYFTAFIFLAALLTGCYKSEDKVISNFYIYNLNDKSIKKVDEAYKINEIHWSPDSKYFFYYFFEEQDEYCRIRVRNIDNLQVVKTPLEKQKYKDGAVNYTWNTYGEILVSTTDNSKYIVGPSKQSLETAKDGHTDEYKVNTSATLSDEELSGYRKKLGSRDNRLEANADKTKILFVDNTYKIYSYDMISGKKEYLCDGLTPHWSPTSKNIIYTVPKKGLKDFNYNHNHNSDYFDTYIINLVTHEKIKLADFYGAEAYFSPDEKYIVLIPNDFIGAPSM